MDETEPPALSPRSSAELDSELRLLTLAVTELASIQTDVLRAMERAAREDRLQRTMNFDALGGSGRVMLPAMDDMRLRSLRSRTQSVLEWLVNRTKQP